MVSGPVKVLLVCEGDADYRTAPVVVDHVLYLGYKWLDGQDLSHYREWQGPSQDQKYLKLSRVRQLAIDYNVNLAISPGFAEKTPAEKMLQKALRVALHIEPKIDAVVLVWDEDTHPKRSDIRPEVRSAFLTPHAVGVAKANRESWLISVFKPESKAEQDTLAKLRQELGFSPTEAPHRLTAKKANSKKSSKRVLDKLTASDHSREVRSIQEQDMVGLLTSGRHNGLEEFVKEVHQHILPRIVGDAPPPLPKKTTK